MLFIMNPTVNYRGSNLIFSTEPVSSVTSQFRVWDLQIVTVLYSLFLTIIFPRKPMVYGPCAYGQDETKFQQPLKQREKLLMVNNSNYVPTFSTHFLKKYHLEVQHFLFCKSYSRKLSELVQLLILFQVMRNCFTGVNN